MRRARPRGPAREPCRGDNQPRGMTACDGGRPGAVPQNAAYLSARTAAQSAAPRAGRPAAMRPSASSGCPRAGFSLIEVIIATAILMGSAVVLARLAGMGREQSQKAALSTTAQQLCEQTLHELLAGLRPLEVSEDSPLLPLPEPIPEQVEQSDITPQWAETTTPSSTTEAAELDETNPAWRHSIRMDLLPEMPGMWCLTVVVRQGDLTLARPVSFSLTRWIAGPPPPGAFDALTEPIGESAQPPFSEQFSQPEGQP